MHNLTDISQEDDKGTFVRLNEANGCIETICMYTGDIIDSTSVIKDVDSEVRTFLYNGRVADAVIHLIREGSTIRDICLRPGFPPRAVIASWMRRFPEFQKKVVAAEADRSDYFHDRILQEAEELQGADRDTIAAAKVRIDVYKWAAKVGNGEKYSDKVSVDNKHSGQVGFYALRTGIDRGEPSEAQVVSEDE